MVAEFNNNRGFNKRARDPFPSVSIPFNPDKFNFNKIKKEEILFELKPEENLYGRGEIIQALVNISPINFCHNLYVIDPKKVCLKKKTPILKYDYLESTATFDERSLPSGLRFGSSVEFTWI